MTADPHAFPPDPRVAALTAALDAITAACTSALADHRRGCPTYGLVSAGLIAAIAEEAKAHD